MTEIPISRFLQCHLDYLSEFEDVERRRRNELKAAKSNLIRSTNSLISHPDISRDYKLYLMEFKKTL